MASSTSEPQRSGKRWSARHGWRGFVPFMEFRRRPDGRPHTLASGLIFCLERRLHRFYAAYAEGRLICATRIEADEAANGRVVPAGVLLCEGKLMLAHDLGSAPG